MEFFDLAVAISGTQVNSAALGIRCHELGREIRPKGNHDLDRG